MKICHVTSVHKRYDQRIFVKECSSLAANEYETYLIVNDELPDEVKNDVNILSIRSKHKSRWRRIVSVKKDFLKKCLEIDADVYHLHDPELLPLGTTLQRRGKSVIFDSHEDVPTQLIKKHWIPLLLRRFVSVVYERYEKRTLRKFAAVISVTPYIVNRLNKVNPNTYMVTNYPRIEDFPRLEEEKANFAICFIGGIKPLYNHHHIINILEKMEGVTYILGGDGLKEYMNRLHRSNGWDYVDYIGEIPYSKLNEVYQSASVGIGLHGWDLGPFKTEGSLGVIKIFEFMAAGLPVIVTNFPLWKKIINKNQCGICVDPENEDEIIAAIQFFIDHPNQVKIMGQNGRKAVERYYNWMSQENVLLQAYHSIYLQKIKKL